MGKNGNIISGKTHNNVLGFFFLFFFDHTLLHSTPCIYCLPPCLIYAPPTVYSDGGNNSEEAFTQALQHTLNNRAEGRP